MRDLTDSSHRFRRVLRATALAVVALAVSTTWRGTAQSSDPCAPPLGNPITCENQIPGNPQAEWDVQGAGDPTIQGFATDISVNRGQTIQFKVDTNATGYRLDIYRMGYYAGAGARKITTVFPSVSLPQNQPECLNDFSTGLVDCGNWAVSASWAVPSNATSGIYFARLRRNDNGGASHIVFVVRQDNSTSDILFQTSDTTWQAYNRYGGNSLYLGNPAGRAFKVSYNRPFTVREVLDGYGQPNWVFWSEYPMVRFLEANGYDITYTSGIDVERRASQLLTHRMFLTAGHDEYWSAGARASLEAARNAGVNLSLFSGNYMYWKTRFEPSIDGSNTAFRTLVSYKETLDGAKTDPNPAWTGTWRDPRFSPPSDGGRAENALAGPIFTVNRGVDGLAGTPIAVPSEQSRARIWRNTQIANLPSGTLGYLADNTLGYEWDEDLDNGFRPQGLIRLSRTTEDVPDKIVSGYGAYEDFGPGTATHSLTLYRHSSGALVFGAGTVQWSWGLDSHHDGATSVPNTAMQQATINLFADMGVQPRTLLSGLQPASASLDNTPPTAVLTNPTPGASLVPGVQVIITGTASDAGGGVVSGVEVSVDGQTWHPANGLESWSYAWTPTVAGTYTVRARAIDDSARIQPTPAAATVSVAIDATAPQITARTPTPGATSVSAGAPITATFNETMLASSFTSATVELRNPSNQVVAGTVSYDANTRTVSLQPTATLPFSTTYTARIRGGSSGVKDFSGNALAADATWTFTTWASPPCPCSLWDPTTTTPTVIDSNDTTAYELGVKFRADYDGVISGLRFYKSAANTGAHVGHLWRADGTLIGTVNFTNETASGWQEAFFATPVTITANTVYVASYYAPNGHYAVNANYFSTGAQLNSPLRAPATGETPNGVFKAGASAFPDESFNGANYWVDVIYLSVGGDTTAPTITTRVPAPNATNVSSGAPVNITFSEVLSLASVNSSTIQLRNAASQVIPATVGFAVASRTATLQPAATLGFNEVYSVTVRGGATGVKDLAGNSLAADATWTFTTGLPPNCPCSLWDLTTVPTQVDSGDNNPYELGIRFRPEFDGQISAIRYYKAAGNTGAHPVTLWNAAGGVLATALPAAETASGWQEVALPTPVSVTAGQTYVASYYVPNGHYSVNANYFSTSGLARSPLYAFGANEGGNGVFKDGTSGFPTQSFNGGNYWIDVVYVSVGGDSAAPQVTGRTPAPSATTVSASSNVTATFNEAMRASSITATAFELRTAANQVVPATVSYDAATRTAILDPNAPLVFGGSYTARVMGGAAGVKDSFGNGMASDVSWTFTVSNDPSCPCSLWPDTTVPAQPDSGDGNAYELGVKFRASLDGFVTGLRFFKGIGNTGTHVGHLWTSSGALLATATFGSESAEGWQSVTFSTPIAVTSGQTYVASYWAPNGHYAVNGSYFASTSRVNGPLEAPANGETANGVFRSGSMGFPGESFGAANYWVDVTFVPGAGDTVAPTVSSTTPANNGTGAQVSAAIVAQFSEAMNPTSIVMSLRDAANQPVAATVAYDPATLQGSLRPSAPLAFGSVYTARVAAGARDLAGNSLANEVVWSFTTEAQQSCPCSFWSTSTVPSVPDSGDAAAYELGVRFRPQIDGYITAIRFYKGAGNTGVHTAHLWNNTGGAPLATAEFVAETATGWQTVVLPTRVPVLAGNTYVASYFAPNGHYAYEAGAFTSPFLRWPLTALANSEGGNGVWAPGASAFPTNAGNGANYFVDVVFEAMPELTISGVATANRTSTGATVNWQTSIDADGQVDYGTTTSYGSSSALVAARTTGHSIALSGLTANTTYYFRVRSRDEANRTATATGSFTTDVTAPVISSVQSTGVNGTSATITWTTNEAADRQVEYGPTTSYGSLTTLQTTLGTAHSVALSGLSANVVYHYRVRSRDAAGNLAVSGDFTFNTDTTGPVISAVQGVGLATSATISWTTNEASDTQVQYGLTTSYGSTTPLQSAMVTAHTVSLTGLQTGRTYNFRVLSRDAAGNLTTSGNFTVLTDNVDPVISNIVEVPTANGVSITWTTNEASTTQMVYGTSFFFLNQTSPLQPALTTTHTVTLTGLSANQTYYYRVRSRDAAGNEGESALGSFATDGTAPTISAVSATPAPTGATIRWTTNEDADGLVEFGPTTAYGSSSPLQTALTEDHTVTLTGLAPNTTYNYRVRSRDAAGNTRYSTNATFRTDNVAPTLSTPSASAGTTSATISFSTNEPTDRIVEYGTTTSLGSSTTLVTTPTQSHSQSITGLTRFRTYYYRVRVRDAAGNTTYSAILSFRTN